MKFTGWFCMLCAFATINAVEVLVDLMRNHWGWLGLDAGLAVFMALLAVAEWHEANPLTMTSEVPAPGGEGSAAVPDANGGGVRAALRRLGALHLAWVVPVTALAGLFAFLLCVVVYREENVKDCASFMCRQVWETWKAVYRGGVPAPEEQP